MTPIEKYLLLGCLVRNEELLKTAVSKSSGYQLFDNYTDPDCALIWSVLFDCYRACKGMPNTVMVRQEMDSRLKFLRMLEPKMVNGVLDLVLGIDEKELTMPVGTLYLETALGESMKVEWTKRLNRAGGIDEMKDFAGSISKDAASIASGSMTIDDFPLYSPAAYIKYTERIPLGLHFWDEISGGGIARGEVFGFIGPTGGGKTVFAVSVFTARIMRAQHVNLYQYEQPLEGDIMERICTKLTNYPISTFRNKAWEDVDTDARIKYCDAAAKWGGYAHVTSFAEPGKGTGGSLEITSHCDKCIKAGRKPSIIIVDWLGAMIERYMADNNMNGENAYRMLGARFIDEIKMYCQKNYISGLIFHQTRTDVSRANPKYEPKATDAHEFRSFPNKLDAVYCLGTLNPVNNVGWFLGDKNRRGPRNKTFIKLDGENQTFSDAGGNYIVSHKGEFISKDGERVPDAYADMGQDLAKVGN
jgi:hypothetical protein